ncbi:MAG: sodium-dependent transporter [Spirochaetota bacterium]|nr:sodium-dependent transporter [Spirochaetota bacterium]
MISGKQNDREQWKSQFGFLMAALGSAIGLGNIWRFSYMAYDNGGGAFLIPYLIALITAGIPLLILEFGIGHERIGSAPLAFRKYHKQWEWVGWWAIVFIMFGIELYYSVIISWCINYFRFAFNLSWGDNPGHFFESDFLNVSKSPTELGSIQPEILIGLVIVWIVSWFIIYRGVGRGLELANKIFMPLLFILMAILVFWSMTLDGAWDGLKAYLIPDFSKLTKAKVWLDAYSQVFFSLGLGFGIMITYASYLPKKTNITRSALITSLLDSGFAIFAGFAVFAVLGFMANSVGKPVQDVVKGGPGLAFVAYPAALNAMADKLSPTVGKFFGAAFFLSLVVAGFSSAISIIEAFVSALVDKFRWNRKVVVSVVAVVGLAGGLIFTTGAGLHWLDIVDHFLTRYGLVVVGLLECVVVGWFFRIEVLRHHINQVSTLQLGDWWGWTIRMLVPVILIAIIGGSLFEEFSKVYGDGKYTIAQLLTIGFGWLMATIMAAVALASARWVLDVENHASRADDYQLSVEESIKPWSPGMFYFFVAISLVIPIVGAFVSLLEGVISLFKKERKNQGFVLLIIGFFSLIIWLFIAIIFHFV